MSWLKNSYVRDHSFFVGGRGGRWFLGGGGHPKMFEVKGGPSQKLRGGGGSCRYMYLLEGDTQGKIERGSHAKVFRDN